MLANRRYCYPLTITDFATRYLITGRRVRAAGTRPKLSDGTSDAPYEATMGMGGDITLVSGERGLDVQSVVAE